MKKLLSGLLVAVVLSLGASASVGALAGKTDVTGVITANQTAVAGAEVTVTCNGKTEMDTTDANGSYLVVFSNTDCVFGSTVKVVAKKDGMSGVATGTVHGITTKLNLAIVNVEIPEYGLIGAAISAATGLGFIAYMRRRQQAQMQF